MSSICPRCSREIADMRDRIELLTLQLDAARRENATLQSAVRSLGSARDYLLHTVIDMHAACECNTCSAARRPVVCGD